MILSRWLIYWLAASFLGALASEREDDIINLAFSETLTDDDSQEEEDQQQDIFPTDVLSELEEANIHSIPPRQLSTQRYLTQKKNTGTTTTNHPTPTVFISSPEIAAFSKHSPTVSSTPPAILTCPSNYSLDSKVNKCVSHELVYPQEKCPPGSIEHQNDCFVFTRGQVQCPPTYHYTGLQCTTVQMIPVKYTCPDGGTLGESGKECVTTVGGDPTAAAPKCPPGFGFDPQENVCIQKIPASLNCSDGSTPDRRSGTCSKPVELEAQMLCPPGTETDGSKCYKVQNVPAKCPKGYKYGANHGKCYKKVKKVLAPCPPGFKQVQNHTGLCEKRVEIPGTLTCPPESELDPVTGQCLSQMASDPECTDGMSKSRQIPGICERIVDDIGTCPAGTAKVGTGVQTRCQRIIELPLIECCPPEFERKQKGATIVETARILKRQINNNQQGNDEGKEECVKTEIVGAPISTTKCIGSCVSNTVEPVRECPNGYELTEDHLCTTRIETLCDGKGEEKKQTNKKRLESEQIKVQVGEQQQSGQKIKEQCEMYRNIYYNASLLRSANDIFSIIPHHCIEHLKRQEGSISNNNRMLQQKTNGGDSVMEDQFIDHEYDSIMYRDPAASETTFSSPSFYPPIVPTVTNPYAADKINSESSLLSSSYEANENNRNSLPNHSSNTSPHTAYYYSYVPSPPLSISNNGKVCYKEHKIVPQMTCPVGTVLNSASLCVVQMQNGQQQTKKKVNDSFYSCPTNSSYDSSLGKCIKTTIVPLQTECPSGATRVGSRCVLYHNEPPVLTCPPEAVLDEQTKTCVVRLPATFSTPKVFRSAPAVVCPTGSLDGQKCTNIERVPRMYICPDGSSQAANGGENLSIMYQRKLSESTNQRTSTSPSSKMDSLYCYEYANLIAPPPIRKPVKPMYFCSNGQQAIGKRCSSKHYLQASPVCPPGSTLNQSQICTRRMTPVVPEPRLVTTVAVAMCPNGTSVQGTKCIQMVHQAAKVICPEGYQETENRAVSIGTMDSSSSTSSMNDVIKECSRQVSKIKACPLGTVHTVEGCLNRIETDPKKVYVQKCAGKVTTDCQV